MKIVGMIYAIVGFFILAYLFRKGLFNRKIGYLFIATSTAVGFLFFTPMFPYQLQMLVLGKGNDKIMAIVGILLFIVLTFIFGRIFCGYLCPIGAVQELTYYVPTKKLKITNKAPVAVHAIFFGAFLISGLAFSVGILNYLGLGVFFHLNFVSPFFYVFLALLITSAFIYRPFCRFFCPYGLLLSLVSIKSLFKLRRNDNCTDCKKCERICPTNEAGEISLKMECYMCYRCKEACKVNAIEYSLTK